MGMLVVVGWAWWAGWPGALVATDLSQERANVVLPTPGETIQVRQTFTPKRDGLSRVELLLASDSEASGPGRIQVQLLNETGSLVARRTVENREGGHNRPLLLRFAPQLDSADQEYTLLLGGTAGNGLTVWGYALDVLAGGAAATVGAASQAADLHLQTQYTLTAPGLANVLGQVVSDHAMTGVLLLAVLVMPGLLLMNAFGRPRRLRDPAVRLGVAVVLGAATWPVLWQFTSLVGLRWAGWSLALVLVSGWLAVLALWLRSRSREDGGQSRVASRWHWEHGLLAIILMVGLLVRLLAVRDLAFPPWVDSVRHALITAVMAADGQVLHDYRPWLPVDRFPYHYGFQTLAASLRLLSDAPLPGLLLGMGQWLNALVPLSVYAATVLLSGRRRAGLLAAFLVALPFLFPAYYATWGRLTQLTAVLILPVALALTWQLIRGGPRWVGLVPLLGLSVAGLFLIHARVFLLYLPFPALVWLVSRGRRARQLLGATALGLILVAARLFTLVTTSIPALTGPAGSYNAFPVGYVQTGWEQAFLWLGAVAFGVVVLASWRGRRWAWLPLLLVTWSAVAAVALAGSRLELPETGLINLNSAYIVFFVPLALLLALVGERTWRSLWDRAGRGQGLLMAACGAMLMATALFGLHQQVTILNPTTILARPADEPALSWLAERPPGKVAASSWRWLGQTWAGQDGGAWIVPLTGWASTIPPADYTYNRDLAAEVRSFNEWATAVKDWSDPTVVERLRSEGVTHLFVGQRGGFLEPTALARNPVLEMVYQNDGAFIFAVGG